MSCSFWVPWPLDAWNDVALGVEHIRLLHVVAVALLVTMQISDVAGDQHTLDVEPGSRADAIPRIHARRVALLLLTEIGVPGATRVRRTQGLRLLLAHLVGPSEPAKIAGLVGVLGNKEADVCRWRGRSLLRLRQQGCRPQKRDRDGGKNDRFTHSGYLPQSLF